MLYSRFCKIASAETPKRLHYTLTLYFGDKAMQSHLQIAGNSLIFRKKAKLIMDFQLLLWSLKQ